MKLEEAALEVIRQFESLEHRAQTIDHPELAELTTQVRIALDDLKEAVAATHEELQDLKALGKRQQAMLDRTSNLSRHENGLYYHGSDQDHPYCPNCFDNGNATQLANLNSGVATYFCQKCRFMAD